MVQIIARISPSVSNLLLRKMQIIQLLNLQPLSKEEFLLVMFMPDFYLKLRGITQRKGTVVYDLSNQYVTKTDK